MLNQIKADFYKLRHSMLFWIIGGVALAIFALLVFMSNGSGVFSFGFVQEYVGKVPVAQGFIAFTYEDPANPTFWELVYSSTAFVCLLWVVLMSLALQFYSKEFQTGTIKLSVAYGTNKFVLFFSKLIVIITYFGVLYYAYNLLAFAFITRKAGYTPTFDNILSLLQLTTLYFLVFIVFTLLCLTVYTLMKNTVVVSILLVVFMYSLIFVLLAIYGKEPSAIIKLYLVCNPMYYLWYASGFWAKSSIVKEILLYFAVGVPVLTACTYFILKRQEIK